MPTLKDHTLATFIILSTLFLGAFFHIHNLGNPGFWGDEETSSMPARSLALGNGAVFPSGMEYRRALPQTYLNALSAKIFGINKDLSYRVPSSVFGIATLILIFFGTAKFFGLPVALTATALLSFSEWHIILSRTARMYGPLLFFTISFCFVALTWHYKTKKHRHLLLACILFLIASIFNYLAIIVLPILFIPIIFQKFNIKTFTLSLAATTTLGIISTLYFKVFVNAPYKEIQASRLSQITPPNTHEPTGASLLLDLPVTEYILIAAGLISGAYIFYKLNKRTTLKYYPLISIGLLIASISISFFILHGKAYGALICAAFILIFLSNLPGESKALSLKIAAIITVIIALMISINIFNHGLTGGLKESFNYPFPYLLYQLLEFPGIIILFIIGILDAVFSPANKQREIIKTLTIVTLLPTFMLGLALNWAPPRYLVTTYPLLLIIASYGLICLINRVRIFKNSEKLKLIAATLIPASGILGGHGIPQATAVSPSEYGSYIYSNHISGIKYPDHRSLGCFVKKHLQENDIVIAEDALQMYWYIGQVDYWLRTPSSIDDFLYLDTNNELRDIYVNSKPSTKEVITSLSTNTKNQIWVITSGETQQHLDSFLYKNSPQRNWLEHVIRTQEPVLKGRDGISATYCLNCKFKSANANPWNFDCQ